MTRLRWRGSLVITVLLLLLPTLAMAQAQTGGMAGVVRDPSGAVISGATVEIYNIQTGVLERRLTTTSDGLFVATLLRPGDYRVEVKNVPGFRGFVTNVSVRINETAKIVADLKVGEAKETVIVEAAASLVNTESAQTGQAVDKNALENLPTPVPNFMYLLTLSAGTAGEPPDPRVAGRGNVDINVNGNRTTNNSATLEGININDFNLAHFDTIPLPNPNALQEFVVATSLYDASMGGKGGGAVNLVLRTGTKDWHWSAYWQHRNDAMNARDWFYNRDNPDAHKQKLLQNVLGFSGSGPVPIIKGFWFANVQGLRFRNAVDTSGAISRPTVPWFPTDASGATSAALLATPIAGRWSGIPSGNPADIDPVAVNILNLANSYYGGTYLIPRSGQSGCPTASATGLDVTFRCTFSKVIPGEDFQHSVTYDRTFRGDKDKLSLRWFHDNGEFQAPYGAGGSLSEATGNQQRNRFATIQYTLQISPSQLNQFRFGYSRFKSAYSPQDLVMLADVGATRPNEAEIPGIYNFAISGLFDFGTAANDDRGTISNTFSWSDTWSYTRGKHTLRAGGQIDRFQLNRYNRFVSRGLVGFTQIGTCPGPTCITPLQAFLMGRITSTQAGAGIPDRYFRDTDLYFFIQDDFRIRRNLTLNIGVRWEGLGFGTELLNRLGNYIPTDSANPFVYPETLDLAGFTGVATGSKSGDCLINNCRDINNWAPRVGFAWDIFGNQKTVLRGGYGIYYQRLSNQTTLQTNLAPPFNVQLINTNASGLPGQQLANPFPTLPPANLISWPSVPQQSFFAGVSGTGDPNDPANSPIFVNEDGVACSGFGGTAINCAINLASFTAADPKLGSPYTQQWNLMLQRELFHGWAAEIGYVGSHYVGGIGIYNPFVRQASPSDPITVSDIYGNSYTITTNTVRNEPLRNTYLGLTRSKGARYAGNIGQAIYHALQTTVSHRFRDGLYFQAAYTWAHAIDNVSGSMSTDELNATRNGQLGANMLGLGNVDPRLNRARGDFDRPHRLVISYTYDLPIPKSSNAVLSRFVNDWGISGVTYFQSGLPFTLTATTAGAWGGGTNTPVFACASLSDAYTFGSMYDRVNSTYLNASCFAQPGAAPNSAGTGSLLPRDYGTLPRNAFRGPFQQQWDFSVSKAFKITERHTVKFRTDFFNIINHPIFRAPNGTSISTPSTLGQITNTTIPSRLVQFNLRYDF